MIMLRRILSYSFLHFRDSVCLSLIIFISVLLTACTRSKSIKVEYDKIDTELLLYDIINSEKRQLNNVCLHSVDGDTLKLKSCVDSCLSLVIYIPNLSCTSCSQKEVAMLKDIIHDESKRIMILACFDNKRDHSIFQSKFGLKIYDVGNNTLFKNKEDNEISSIFMIDDSLETMVYIDLSTYAHLSRIYYEAFSDRYKNPTE